MRHFFFSSKSFLVLLLFLFFQYSCNSSTNRKPTNVLSEEALVALLSDIHLADGVVSTKSIPGSFQIKDSTLYKELYVLHNVTQAQMDSTVAYYMKHKPRVLNQVYNQVLISLSRMQGDLDAL